MASDGRFRSALVPLVTAIGLTLGIAAMTWIASGGDARRAGKAFPVAARVTETRDYPAPPRSYPSDVAIPSWCTPADFGGAMVGCVFASDVNVTPEQAVVSREATGYQGVPVYAPDDSSEVLGYYIGGMTGYVQNSMLSYIPAIQSCDDRLANELDAKRTGTGAPAQPLSDDCRALLAAQGQNASSLRGL